MKNIENWVPTKLKFRRGRLIGNRDARELGIGSRLITDATARLYQQYIPIHFRGRLIDLGCGKVPFYEAYRDYVDEVVCVDWPGTLHSNPHIDLFHDLNQPLPFQDAAFDTVLLSDVLEHIPEPQQLCQEISRILKPGGKCVMNSPFMYWIHEAPFDFHRYTRFALARLFDKVGMEAIVIEATGGAPEILADISAKNAAKIPLLGRIMASAIQAATSVVVGTNLGRKVSRASAERFPLSYFVVASKKPH